VSLSEKSKIILSYVIVAVVTLALILAAEAIVRVRQYINWGTFSAVNTFHTHEVTGLRIPTPGMKTRSIEINSLGFRGPEINSPKPSGSLRIAFIGASTTYCAEVSGNDQVWTDQVSRSLKSMWPDLSVDYINAGVGGYTAEDSLVNLDVRVLPLEPDVIVIYHGTNDISADTRTLAERAGIKSVNLALEESWLSKYSLLWMLVEKNLSLMTLENTADAELLEVKPDNLGSEFRENLRLMVQSARERGVSVVALATFSTHLRPGMTAEQRDKAMVSSRYYMPYLSADSLLALFNRYNQIIREVAKETGALLIGNADGIPGDPVHFNDSVHFTDAGSKAQADRVAKVLLESSRFLDLVDSKLSKKISVD